MLGSKPWSNFEKTDVYALGFVLYTFCFKKYPLDVINDANKFEKSMESFLSNPKYIWDNLEDINNIPDFDQLKNLIDGMLHVKPENRFTLK